MHSTSYVNCSVHGVTVSTLDLTIKLKVVGSTSGRVAIGRVDVCRQVNQLTIHVNLAFHPSGVGKSSTAAICLAGVKAGGVHLSRVTGNAV